MPLTSVAPRERVNIVYQTTTGGAAAEKELPLKLLVMADFSGRRDGPPLEERTPLPATKSGFDDLMAAHGVELTLRVPNRIDGDGEIEARVRLASIADFSPEAVARQVPQLARLLAMREALTALKAPLGNVAAFRRRIQDLLADTDTRRALVEAAGADTP